MAGNKTVTLRPLTADNWRPCADLAVMDHQRSWLPSNLLSIAAAQFYPDNFCRAIYVDDHLVGFAMYGIEQPIGRVKIFRLMIDASAQRQGYGATAARIMLREIADRWPASAVYVSYQDANSIARRLYESLGFCEIERAASKITACKTAEGSGGH